VTLIGGGLLPLLVLRKNDRPQHAGARDGADESAVFNHCESLMQVLAKVAGRHLQGSIGADHQEPATDDCIQIWRASAVREMPLKDGIVGDDADGEAVCVNDKQFGQVRVEDYPFGFGEAGAAGNCPDVSRHDVPDRRHSAPSPSKRVELRDK
jgi:hypothetical protein